MNDLQIKTNLLAVTERLAPIVDVCVDSEIFGTLGVELSQCIVVLDQCLLALAERIESKQRHPAGNPDRVREMPDWLEQHFDNVRAFPQAYDADGLPL